MPLFFLTSARRYAISSRLPVVSLTPQQPYRYVLLAGSLEKHLREKQLLNATLSKTKEKGIRVNYFSIIHIRDLRTYINTTFAKKKPTKKLQGARVILLVLAHQKNLSKKQTQTPISIL